MKTGIYVRVSTEEQEKGLDSQERAIKEYLNGHGITNAKRYRDRESGGTHIRAGTLKVRYSVCDFITHDVSNLTLVCVACRQFER